MAKVRFGAEASADLDAIYRFSIERFGAVTADVYFDGLEEACHALGDSPMTGQESPLLSGLRRKTYRSHHIYYVYDNSRVTIIRILHHAQDADRHLN